MKLLWNVALAALLPLMTVTAVAQTAPDTVFFNAKVFTSDSAIPRAEAFAVRDGHFLKVGTNDEVRALVEPATVLVDLAGQTVFPGLVDAHSHAIFSGLAALSPNLEDADLDAGALIEKVERWSQQHTGPAPLVIFGVNPSAWSDPRPLTEVFDGAGWESRPLLLMGSDYHTAWANSAMRRLSGIDARRVDALRDSERHTIGTDARGEPNGVLVDAGLDWVTTHLPTPDDAQWLEAGRFAVKANNRYGITAWMDPAANAGPGEALFSRAPGSKGFGALHAYRALSKADMLTAHVAALLVASPTGGREDLDNLAWVRSQFEGVRYLSIPGIKIFADGVLEFPAQSAAMLGEYKNSGERGHTLLQPDQLTEVVDAADARGWLVHIHALGDRAVKDSLDAIEQARSRRNSAVAHSITHLQLVDPQDYPRFAKLNTIAVMQLHWAQVDNYLLDLVKPYISSEAFQGQYPANSLRRHAAVLAGASDWPISTANPWEAMHHAMTRDGPDGGLNASERLDRETLFLAYTRHAAIAIGLADRIGSISAGKHADFIVLDRDVLEVDVESLGHTKVLQTYFGGRNVFTATH